MALFGSDRQKAVDATNRLAEVAKDLATGRAGQRGSASIVEGHDEAAAAQARQDEQTIEADRRRIVRDLTGG